jgi:drug/metabolite transporter (DMT)-like permease
MNNKVAGWRGKPMGSSYFWSKIAPYLCMLGLGIGQILFKTVAIAANGTRILSSPRASAILAAALLLYGLTTIGWINTLRYLPLSRGYPIMALAYVIVPVLSWYWLGEKLSPLYWFGIMLLVAGIIVIGKSFGGEHP